LPITWAADVRIANARAFSKSTFQDLSNDTKNTPMRGVLPLAVESFEHSGVPEDSQPPTFPSVGLHPHTWPKWGCDNSDFPCGCSQIGISIDPHLEIGQIWELWNGKMKD